MADTHRETVVLLPGLLCDGAVWAAQLEGLSDAFPCRVAALGAYDSMSSMARAALALADGMLSVVGHSMGGYVALEVMRQAPERVRRLALLDTQPGRDSPEQSARRELLIARAQAGGFPDVVREFHPLAFHEHARSDASLTTVFDDMAGRVGAAAFVRHQRAIMARPDSSPTVPRISCPTLVLCGRQDLITPLENSQRMATAIPRSTLTVLEDCGHMAPMERPAAVTAALREWMGRTHGTDG